jgi:hypothetical protein
MPTVAPQAVDEPPVAERIVATRRVVTNTGVKEAPLERRRNTSGSGGKLVLWLVLGILAGGVVAFLAAKFVLGIDLTDLQSLRGGKSERYSLLNSSAKCWRRVRFWSLPEPVRGRASQIRTRLGT